MTKVRYAQLKEIASRICNMDPAGVHLDSLEWMEKMGCWTVNECIIVRCEVYDRKGWIA